MKQTELSKLIAARSAHVAVLGLGYVGLPLAIALTNQGFSVSAIDTDDKRIKKLQAGVNYIDDISPEEFNQAISQKIIFSNAFKQLAKADAIIICVPTPLRKTQDPDISYIVAACEQIVKYQHKNQLIILESTTYPGTTEEIMLPALSKDGLKVGRDFFLAFSPERIDPGNPKYKLHNTPKVVGGITAKCTELARALYASIVTEVHAVSNPKVAEMVKLLENTFRAVNIGLVNEIAIICKRLGINTWEVIDAAASKPFGYMPFYPGPGLGGHCIPIDPHYLSWKLKTINYHTRFIGLAAAINQSMPLYVVEMLQEALNQKQLALSKANILLLGVAYKKNVSDTRESPAYEIYEELIKRGARIAYHDPFVPAWKTQHHTLKSTNLTPANLKKYAAVLIITNHDCIDYSQVVKHANLVIDTRNATRGIKSKNIKKL